MKVKKMPTPVVNVELDADLYYRAIEIKEKLELRSRLNKEHHEIEDQIKALRERLKDVESELTKSGLGNTVDNMPGHKELRNDLLDYIMGQLK